MQQGRPNTVVLGALKDNKDAKEFVKVIQTAHSERCNVVFMSDNKQLNAIQESSLKKGESNEIHVWWDGVNEENSELMLVFSYMLQRQAHGNKKDKICVKAIIPNERARSAKEAQFKALSEKLRVHLEVDLYVTQNTSNEEFFSLVRLFSAKAKIIFLSLTPPPLEEKSTDSYAKYLWTLSKSTEALQDVAMVLSSEHTPLDKVLQ